MGILIILLIAETVALWLLLQALKRSGSGPAAIFTAYKCDLWIMRQGGAACEGIVYDFSMYQDYGIIGLIDLRKEPIEESDGVVLLGQTVYKTPDGNFIWDYEGVLE